MCIKIAQSYKNNCKNANFSLKIAQRYKDKASRNARGTIFVYLYVANYCYLIQITNL